MGADGRRARAHQRDVLLLVARAAAERLVQPVGRQLLDPRHRVRAAAVLARALAARGARAAARPTAGIIRILVSIIPV